MVVNRLRSLETDHYNIELNVEAPSPYYDPTEDQSRLDTLASSITDLQTKKGGLEQQVSSSSSTSTSPTSP